MTFRCTASASRYPVRPRRRVFWCIRNSSILAVVSATNTYVFRGLPAGAYFVCAIPEADGAHWLDPQYLAQLVTRAVRVTVRDAERVTQNLTLPDSVNRSGDGAGYLPAIAPNSDSNVDA